jgi:hypothetical protein
VNQGHEQIANLRPVQRAVEQSVLAVKNGLLQRPLTEVMPTPGLCRVSAFPNRPACFLKAADAA